MEKVMGNCLKTKCEPRIYVACLAAYNNGYLHGAWIDASQGEWGIWEDIQKMLAASPIPDAEEHAIHDYEGFEGARISEYTGIETVAKLAAFITEHGALGGAVLNYYNNDLDEASEALTERYLGQYTSLADYVQEMTEDSMTIPQSLHYYIDWQAMARDAEINGDLFTISTAYNEVHVFAGC
jgi:antirestriction protein